MVDECQFFRQGIINTHNTHYCSLGNPHLIWSNRHQVSCSVNLWCGILKSTLTGPIYFDGLLTSESYSEILSGLLADFLEGEVSLWDLSRMWSSMMVHRTQICATMYIFGADIWYSNNRLRRSTDHPRSPDLSPLDFFLWGFLKSKVYERKSLSKSN